MSSRQGDYRSSPIALPYAALCQDPEDGDYHVNLKPDPEFEQLLNHANLVQVGTLVVELVPADQAGCMVGQPPRPPHGNEDYGISPERTSPSRVPGTTSK
jgi:hypothetical protein